MNETIAKPSLWKKLLAFFLILIIGATIFYSCSAFYKVSSYKPRNEEIIGRIFESNDQQTVLLFHEENVATFSASEEMLNGDYAYELTENVLYIRNDVRKISFVFLSKEEMLYQDKNVILFRMDYEG